jgi:hypothetical protein
MKKMMVVLVILILSLGCVIGTISAAGSPFDKILTVADVTKVTGMTGLKLVDKDAVQGAFGQINFTGSDGKVLLVVTIETHDPKEFAKVAKTKSFQSLYAGPFKGVGDVTYESPVTGERYMVAFMKGNHFATVSSTLNYSTMKPIISMKQLREIAAIIIIGGKW